VSTNYLVLACVLAFYLLISDTLECPPDAIKVGIITGIVFVASMFMMTRALEISDVAGVLTAFRMSIILPIGLAVWIWDERTNPIQVAGIFLSLIALYLMTPSPGSQNRLQGAGAFGLLLSVFGLQGLAHTCMRWVHYAGLSPDLVKVLVITGLTAGVAGTIFIFFSGKRPTRPELAMGAGIGVFSSLALTINLVALSHVPGTIYFPIMGSAVVLMDNLAAHFFWREPLRRGGFAGASLAIFAIVLVVGWR
jgi:drug/metabolite transporter (DMT)-like permease